METFLFFMLGALLVGVGVLTHVLVKTVSKVSQLEKNKSEENFRLDNETKAIYNHIAEIKRELHDCDERMIQDYSKQFDDMNRRCDEILTVIHDSIESMENSSIRELHNRIDETMRMMDSRFDKFDNKLDGHKNELLRTTSNMIDETVKKDLIELNKRIYELQSAQMGKRVIKG